MMLHQPLRAVAIATAIASTLVSAIAADGDRAPKLRLVCASSLEENQPLALALRGENGKFKSLGDIELRSSLVTDWIPAQAGELHLMVKEKKVEPKSLAQFTYPTGASQVLVLLHADPEKKTYQSAVIDPRAVKFGKGTVFICNFSGKSASIALGTEEVKTEIGKHLIAKPGLDDQGMYRLTVSMVEGEAEPRMMYDRQLAGNPNSRDILFLLPDESGGIQVQSLPIFGDLGE